MTTQMTCEQYFAHLNELFWTQRVLSFIRFSVFPLDANPSLLQFPISVDCRDSVPSGPAKAPALPKSATRIEMPPVEVSAGQTLVMLLSLTLPHGTKLTAEAPSFWALTAEGEI